MQNRPTIAPRRGGTLGAVLVLLVALPLSLAAQASVNTPVAPNGGGMSAGSGGVVLWSIIGEPMAENPAATGSMNTDDLFIGSIVVLYPEADLSGVEEWRTGGAASTTSLTASPSPVSDEVTFTLTLAQPGVVHLAVYDMLGRTVAVPVEGVRESGVFTIRWRPGHIPAGQYVARLTVDGTEGATLPLQFVH